MTLDPVLLSRLQWAWVIAWHILLPAFTVGLASYIAVLEGLYFFTGWQIWFRISGFWTRIFGVSFGMGVVSGIIMPFQFGTNWSRFTDAAADTISPLLSYGSKTIGDDCIGLLRPGIERLSLTGKFVSHAFDMIHNGLAPKILCLPASALAPCEGILAPSDSVKLCLLTANFSVESKP